MRAGCVNSNKVCWIIAPWGDLWLNSVLLLQFLTPVCKCLVNMCVQGDLDGDFEGVVVALSPSDDDLSPVPSGDTTDLEAALDAADQGEHG